MCHERYKTEHDRQYTDRDFSLALLKINNSLRQAISATTRTLNVNSDSRGHESCRNIHMLHHIASEEKQKFNNIECFE